MATANYEVGRRVKVMLKSRTMIEGIIFAVDNESKRLVLEESVAGESSDLRNVRIVNLAAVETFSVDESAPVVDPLVPLSKETAIKREKASFRAKEEALLRAVPPLEIHDSLSRTMYEAMSKTYDCRWNEREKKIEIKDLGVTIKHPFRAPQDVHGQDSRAVKWICEMVARLRLPK